MYRSNRNGTRSCHSCETVKGIKLKILRRWSPFLQLEVLVYITVSFRASEVLKLGPSGMYHAFSISTLVLLAARCLSFPIDDRSQPSIWLSSSSASRPDAVRQSHSPPRSMDSSRIPVTPSGEGQGWLARWLSMGGEGIVTVSVGY